MAFSDEQRRILINRYIENPNPTTQFRRNLAASIGLSLTQVSGWYYNRRFSHPRLNNTRDSDESDTEVASQVGPGAGLPSCSSNIAPPDSTQVNSGAELPNPVTANPAADALSTSNTLAGPASSSLIEPPSSSQLSTVAAQSTSSRTPVAPILVNPTVNQPTNSSETDENAMEHDGNGEPDVPNTEPSLPTPSTSATTNKQADAALKAICRKAKSLPAAVCIPRDILGSFGAEGLIDDDNEEITDIEEMVFQNILRKKLVCDIYFTHLKKYKCSKCSYSLCEVCFASISHAISTPCPQCRVSHANYLPLILPRL